MSTLNRNHKKSSVPEKTAGKLPEDSQKRSFSKSDARYWQAPGRLFKDHDVPDYSCRFSLRGNRGQFCLNTSNQREAAKRAADLFTLVAREGMDAGYALYRPKKKAVKSKAVTVGVLIAEAVRISSARRNTLYGYAKAFRLIVSEIKAISGDGKFDAYKGGTMKWREKVDAVSLGSITPTEVIAWKNKRLRAAEDNPLTKRRAVVTVNSLMRNAEALFGKKLLPFIEQSITLPRPLPFDGVPLEKEPSLRYISKIDAYATLAQAREDLAETEPEAFKVIVLALVFGLRRAEIDNLLWSSFDFPNSTLRVESTEYHELKSEDSAGNLDLSADILALFRSYRAKDPAAIFVIKSRLKHIPNPKPGRYRCNPIFKKSIAWLRKNNVDEFHPNHTLRKETGSVMFSEHGILDASRYLRHSDINVTAAYYVDKKKGVTPGIFNGLLGNPVNAQAGDSSGSKDRRKKLQRKRNR